MGDTAKRTMLSTIHFSRARLLGIVLAIVGILLLLLAYDSQLSIDEIGDTNDPLLQNRISRLEDQRNLYLISAVGLVFMGLFAVGMLVEPSSPRTVSEKQMIGAARMTGEVLRSLSIEGNATYLPPRHGATKERVFISETRKASVPPVALSDDLVLSPGKDGSTPGILIEPLGLQLLNSTEKELGISLVGTGLESAEGSLQFLKHGLGMMRDFHFKERDGKTVLRVEYGGLMDACRTVRKEMPNTCRQAACFGCSCLLAAAARATGKMVTVEEVDNSQDSVIFTLNIREW